MRTWLGLMLLTLATAAAAQAAKPYGPDASRFNSGYEEPEVWQEQRDVEPPAYPREENLREFYVGAIATNTYYVDLSSITLGTDRVVRYVLVVKTSGGATNVSFEGINCAELRWKLYASGRSDKAWTKSRVVRNDWRLIENKSLNPYHAALSRNYFCPMGNAIVTADEGRNALQQGKHPGAN